MYRYFQENADITDFICESDFETKSHLSEFSHDGGLSVSSYDWVFRGSKITPSSASSETLIDENSLSDQETKKSFTNVAIDACSGDTNVISYTTRTRRTSSFSFPSSPRRRSTTRSRNCKSMSMRRIVYECSSSESLYETAKSQVTGYCNNSNSSRDSKYTLSWYSSSSSDDFAEVMKVLSQK